MTRSTPPDPADPSCAAAVPARVTDFLGRVCRSSHTATDELMPLVYDDLRRLAERWLTHERRGPTLQPTALVHEAYLRLARSGQEWQSRAHFFGSAARAIRRILLDRARARRSDRHGGGRKQLPLEAAAGIEIGGPQVDLLALDEALERLRQLDAQKARVVELRFFGGLGVDDTAEVLGTSASKVERDWRFARAWLHRELEQPGGEP